MTDAIPYCRDDPPWSDCGDPGDPEFGRLFAWRAARGALAFTFDRRGRKHALTLFGAAEPAGDIVLMGRRFRVVRDARPEAWR
ncbi:MAG TPA: ABC transporter permease [Caulobacteraceae bacterium]|jgi:hypothetical protein